MKIRSSKLSDKEKMQTLDALYTAASSIRGRKAMKLFLRDLLTESERIMCGRRILIARMLLSGDTYADIRQRLGASVDTVSKVQRWLNDQLPGYEHAIQEMEREFEERRVASPDRFSFAALKRKYPLHFLLFRDPKK